MTIEVDGPFCGCGKRGCLEAVASRTAIAKEVAALAARSDAPWIFENCGTELYKIRSGALQSAIEAGDTLVEAVVRRAAYYVGIAVGNLVNVLSPEAVVLGGGLVEAMEDLYMAEARRGLDDHAMPFLRRNVKLLAARLGDDAVAKGAGHLVAERLADTREP
jgi:glucokinase